MDDTTPKEKVIRNFLIGRGDTENANHWAKQLGVKLLEGKNLSPSESSVLASILFSYAERGEAAQVIGDGPVARVVFTDEPVRDYRSARGGDAGKGRAVMLGLFTRGVFLNTMGTKLNLSLAHDGAACDACLDRFDAALADLA